MISQLRLSLASLFLFVVVGCGDATSPAERSPSKPQLAKQPGPMDSQVIVVWDDAVDAVPTGIRGDGRDATGQPTIDGANAYQGSYCGVWGVVYSLKGESGNVRFDPDTYYDGPSMSAACGGRRSQVIYPSNAGALLGPAQASYSEAIFYAVWQLALGQSSNTEMRIGPVPLPDGTICTLDYNHAAYVGSNSAFATRLPDVQVTNSAGATTARQWRVVSQGNHNGECLVKNPRSGNLVDSGRQVYLPFAVTITEMPAPYLTFP